MLAKRKRRRYCFVSFFVSSFIEHLRVGRRTTNVPSDFRDEFHLPNRLISHDLMNMQLLLKGFLLVLHKFHFNIFFCSTRCHSSEFPSKGALVSLHIYIRPLTFLFSNNAWVSEALNLLIHLFLYVSFWLWVSVTWLLLFSRGSGVFLLPTSLRLQTYNAQRFPLFARNDAPYSSAQVCYPSWTHMTSCEASSLFLFRKFSG